MAMHRSQLLAEQDSTPAFNQINIFHYQKSMRTCDSFSNGLWYPDSVRGSNEAKPYTLRGKHLGFVCCVELQEKMLIVLAGNTISLIDAPASERGNIRKFKMGAGNIIDCAGNNVPINLE